MNKSQISIFLILAISIAFGAAEVSANHHAAEEQTEKQPDENSLANVLDEQSEDAKARYQYRHPKQTLEFFGIEPGMTVGEVLPGGGWYTKILLPYLGESGHLVGIDYSLDMWPHFGGFADEEFIEKKKTWPATWTEEAQPWRGEHGASIAATTFGAFSEDSAGTLDAILFFRAMHNMARFEDKGEFFTKAIADSFTALKAGGIVGIVQHQAREDRPDEWAGGSNGYLKKSYIVGVMQAAGFELEGESDLNSNDKDQAGEGDFVWRLPPSLSGAKDDEEKKAKMLEIGESNRMTLKFRKPA